MASMCDRLATGDFIDLFLRLAKVSTIYDANDWLHARALRRALEEFQINDWHDAICTHPSATMLTLYQSDGWGATLKSQAVAQAKGYVANLDGVMNSCCTALYSL